MVKPNLHDEAPVAAEPGFYEPGRSPSLLLANWFWLRHIIRALRHRRHESLRAFDEMDAATGVRERNRHVNGCEGVATLDYQLSTRRAIKSGTTDGIL